MMNASLFEWVIENLCKNAIDAMEGKGRITITVKEEAKRVVFHALLKVPATMLNGLVFPINIIVQRMD